MTPTNDVSLEKKISIKNLDSPNVLNVTKTSRLRYAGHMIRRPEDLPQKALFRANSNGRRNQGSLAQGVRDWTHCAQDRQSWRDILQQALVLVVVPHK
jgi:hypothetical protein